MLCGKKISTALFKRVCARPLSSAADYQPQLHPTRVNKNVLDVEYAVRGKLVLMAEEMEGQLKAGKKLPFEEIIYCNIGNPQQVGQAPLSFPRQVLSMCINPELLNDDILPITKQLYPEDAIAKAKETLKHMKGGTGSYTHSMGLPWVRQSVARFIEERDGVPASADNIFLTNGASEGVALMLNILIRGKSDAVLVPIPQYPLYSATLSLLGGTELGYGLNEQAAWSADIPHMQAQVDEAQANGISPRALVVINPGNPAGQVLSAAQMEKTIEFCRNNNLVLMADEVYQTNIYSDKPFHSFKKVLHNMGEDYQKNFELVSFHSTSKGYLGECGMRGGYLETTGISDDVKALMYKLRSIALCSNVPGQLMTELMVNPPREGQASHALFEEERNNIVTSLGRRAEKCAKAFNELEGMSCNPAEGSMYLFPEVNLPSGAKKAAATQGLAPDALYSIELLQATGICVVPGSGFGQKDGTFHFRTTFLPPEGKMDGVISRMKVFHGSFMEKYKN